MSIQSRSDIWILEYLSGRNSCCSTMVTRANVIWKKRDQLISFYFLITHKQNFKSIFYNSDVQSRPKHQGKWRLHLFKILQAKPCHQKKRVGRSFCVHFRALKPNIILVKSTTHDFFYCFTYYSPIIILIKRLDSQQHLPCLKIFIEIF